MRRVLLSGALPASVGAIGAAGIAAKEIATQDYARHGLWRTAIWLLSHHTLVGAAAGAAAGILMVLLLVGPSIARSLLRPRAASQEGRPLTEAALERAPRLALIIGVCATGVAVAAPTDGPTRLGMSYELAAGACLVALWVVASASASAGGSSEDDRSPVWRGLVWPVVVGSGYVLAFLHMWSRVEDARRMVILSGAAAIVAVIGYHILDHRAHRLVERLSSVFGRRIQLASATRAAVGVLACSAVLWAAGWAVGLRARAQARESRPNVIIIAVDTLRWDAVSLQSAGEHERDLTPNLRRLLSSRGIVFSNAMSQAPWTLPAFASIFTGLYPEQHGAEHLISELSPDQLTLAEILRDAGYFTMSVVSGHFVTSAVNMTQGFALYDESQAPGTAGATSARITDKAIAMLANHRDDRFFLFAHYFDPHNPYVDHEEFDFTVRSGDPPIVGPGGVGPILRRHVGGPLGHQESASIRAFYDEEVAYTDLQIGRLLTFLEEADLWESTYVFFVADHGEEFLDHGSVGHDKTLFQELVHVPLAIVEPARQARGVVTRPVETRWLFDTILDVTRTRPSRERKPSHTLLAASESGERHVRSSTCPSRSDGGGSVNLVWLSCLADERYKLIKDHIVDSVMLFELPEDPGETRDVSADRPAEVRRLREPLEARDAELRKVAATRRAPNPTEEQLRRVRDLGYLQ